jgi:hypothetical protein
MMLNPHLKTCTAVHWLVQVVGLTVLAWCVAPDCLNAARMVSLTMPLRGTGQQLHATSTRKHLATCLDVPLETCKFNRMVMYWLCNRL